MVLGNVYSDDSMDGGVRATQEAKAECVCFYSGQGATMPHGHSLQRRATLSWMKTDVLWIVHFQVL